MPADLSAAPSPFLRSHAGDSVAWFPWDAATLSVARDRGRPVLLHIGYAGSTGADAMTRESFADPDITALLDAHFTCVLVDRDEWPELDRLQQLAYRLLTREDGGWPLTMFLTHDEALPFFGGGYFPAVAKGGQPAFRTVLARVAEYYAAQQAALREQGLALRETLARIDTGDAGDPADDAPPLPAAAWLAGARRALESGFDRRHGGWGSAPKFPQALAIRHLIRHWQAGALGEQPDLQALFMATYSLTRIAEGGLRDHGVGGFFRYCHDAAWQQPQREKALVDNAQLLEAYAEAAVLTGDALFRDVAQETADALLRQFGHAQGGFRTTVAPDDPRQLIGPNALATRALAAVSGVLGREDLKTAALNTLALLRERTPGTLEEHALLLDAILFCQALDDRDTDLAWARRLADALCTRFEDSRRGGFFATATDGTPGFHRLREFSDAATPSGNALAAGALLRLARSTGEARYRMAAERTLRAAGTRLAEQPLAHLGLLAALRDSALLG